MLVEQSFWENEKLVDPQSLSGKAFSSQINRIAHRLIGHQHDFNKEPFLFLLMDKQEINGFFLVKNKASNDRNIIALTKGLLQSVTTEDELAYVFAHELTHFALSKDLGEGANSQVEEIASDINALRYMYEAGYDPTKALVFSEEWASQERQASNIILRALAVHGTSSTRHLAIQTALTKLNLDAGGIARTPTPHQKPAFLEEAHHESWFEQECFRKGYADLSTLERIQFLMKRVSDLTNNARHEEFKRLVSALQVNEYDLDSKEALHHLGDRVLNVIKNTAKCSEHLGCISQKINPSVSNLQPVGEMRDFNKKR